MTAYSREETAERAGVETAFVDRLVELGILAPTEGDRFTGGDVRRVSMVTSFEGAGIAPDAVAAGIRGGAVSLAFLDAPAYERFATLSSETFQQASDRTGIPLELLTVIREAIGLALPSPPTDSVMTSWRSSHSSSSSLRRDSVQPPSSASFGCSAIAPVASPRARRRGGTPRSFSRPWPWAWAPMRSATWTWPAA